MRRSVASYIIFIVALSIIALVSSLVLFNLSNNVKSNAQAEVSKTLAKQSDYASMHILLYYCSTQYPKYLKSFLEDNYGSVEVTKQIEGTDFDKFDLIVVYQCPNIDVNLFYEKKDYKTVVGIGDVGDALFRENYFGMAGTNNQPSALAVGKPNRIQIDQDSPFSMYATNLIVTVIPDNSIDFFNGASCHFNSGIYLIPYSSTGSSLTTDMVCWDRKRMYINIDLNALLSSNQANDVVASIFDFVRDEMVK